MLSHLLALCRIEYVNEVTRSTAWEIYIFLCFRAGLDYSKPTNIYALETTANDLL